MRHAEAWTLDGTPIAGERQSGFHLRSESPLSRAWNYSFSARPDDDPLGPSPNALLAALTGCASALSRHIAAAVLELGSAL